MLGRKKKFWLTYFDSLTALSVCVLRGIGLNHWATVLDDFAILQDHLTLDTRLNLLGGGQFSSGFLHNLL